MYLFIYFQLQTISFSYSIQIIPYKTVYDLISFIIAFSNNRYYPNNNNNSINQKIYQCCNRIPRIGNKTNEKMLDNCKSIYNLNNMKKEELSRIVDKNKAENYYDFLHTTITYLFIGFYKKKFRNILLILEFLYSFFQFLNLLFLNQILQFFHMLIYLYF